MDRGAFQRMVKELGIQPPAPSAAGAAQPQFTPRTDFDAGRLFARYDRAGEGRLDKAAFQALMHDLNTTAGGGLPSAGHAGAPPLPGPLPGTGVVPGFGYSAPQPAPSSLEFEQGRLFQQYDTSGTGTLGQDQFRAFVRDARQGHLGQGLPAASAAPPAPSVGPWAAAQPPASAPYGCGTGIYGGVPPSTSLAVIPTGYSADPGAAPDTTLASLGEAYHTRLHSLSVAAANLMAKREAMLYTLAKLRSRSEEVSASCRAVERETLADTEAILHRLRSAAALKQSLLRHDMDTLAADVAAIDRFAASLAAHSSGRSPTQAGDSIGTLAGRGVSALGATGEVAPSTALDFMREYPGLCSEADRLLSKPVKEEVPVSADDFERETASRLALVQQVAALQELNDSKTSVIEALLREREAAAADVASITEASNAEVQKWVELTDKLTEQLAKAQAGQHLSTEGAVPPLALSSTAVSEAAPET